MEKNHSDNITREILAQSQLEIENPQFDKIVMKKIVREDIKKTIIRNILFYSLTILALEASVFFLMHASQISVPDIASFLGNFPRVILLCLEKARDMILVNGYFILPIIVILIFKKIIDSRLKYL